MKGKRTRQGRDEGGTREGKLLWKMWRWIKSWKRSRGGVGESKRGGGDEVGDGGDAGG